MTRLLSRFFALLLFVFPATAAAQVQLEQYRAAPTPDDGFVLERPTEAGHLRPSFSAHLSYARAPLSYIPNDRPTERVAVVENQLSLSALASLGLFDRFLAYVRVPAVLLMDGSTVTGAPEADGAGLGDISLGARYLLHATDDDVFRLAVSLQAGLPTAQLANEVQQLTGDGGASFSPRLVAEVRPLEVLHVTASVGGRFREDSQTPLLNIGHELTWGFGVGADIVPELLEVRAEAFSAVSLTRFGEAGTMPLEVLLGARTRPIEGLQFGLSGGLGLSNGYGNPVFRGVFTVGWIGEGEPLPTADGRTSTQRSSTPSDETGAPDVTVDHTPTSREDGGTLVEGPSGSEGVAATDRAPTPPAGAPTSEQPRLAQIPAAIARTAGRQRSGDTVARQAPTPPADPRYRTQDRDGDRVVDALDRCPLDREDYDEIDDEDGCPEEDADDDGLADATDHCPLTAGSATEDACAGCPERACMATGGTIDIGEQVRFTLGTDEIREESVPLLTDVLSILETNPQIRRVRIEGHTDNVGDPESNQTLSLARARAIVTWLMVHGISTGRLEGWGCGQDHPLVSNARSAGRAQNRRVEFIIVEPSSGRTLREGCERSGG
ncbi:MAG: OmpA family protein [Sandaracinaceae bacterium]